MKIIIFFLLNLSTFLYLNKIIHPLTLMLLMMMYFLNMFYLILLMNNSSFYPMLIFLIMMGGMLILILYFTSLTKNSMKLLPSNFSHIKGMLIMNMFIILSINNNFNNFELKIFKMNFNQINEFMFSPMKMFSFPMMFLSIMLIFYLLFTLLWIVKICIKFKLPLRKLI